ncbi:MAG: extracellular solute-binding protein [Alphaproteobacteria bacterium]|nr:extracellular solute-binding protein [Alphaproteobacteria bacterium]
MMKLKTIALAGASVFALGVSAPLAADLTITSWGGAYTASQQKAYGAPWEKKSGKSIHWENYNGGLGEIKTQVESGKVTWDIVDILPDQARTGCDEGLFEEIPDAILMKSKDGKTLDEDLMVPRPNKCVAPQVWWSYVPFYDDGMLKGDKPKTLADFYDMKKWPCKRGIHTWGNANIEMALVADGVDPKKVYEVMSTEEGIDRAFKKLDTIKDHVVFWSSGAKPLELVKSGEVCMSIAYNGRVGAAVLSEGEKFVTIWDGQVLEEEWIAVVKGSPNKKAAFDFISFATAPEQQAGQAKYINYGPMRQSAFAIMQAGEPWFHNGKNIMEHMPNRPEVMPRSVFANPEWWADNGDEVNERFKAWMAK